MAEVGRFRKYIFHKHSGIIKTLWYQKISAFMNMFMLINEMEKECVNKYLIRLCHMIVNLNQSKRIAKPAQNHSHSDKCMRIKWELMVFFPNRCENQRLVNPWNTQCHKNVRQIVVHLSISMHSLLFLLVFSFVVRMSLFVTINSNKLERILLWTVWQTNASIKWLPCCCCWLASELREEEKNKIHDVMIHTQITFVWEQHAFCVRRPFRQFRPFRMKIANQNCTQTQWIGWFVYFVLRSRTIFTSIDCNKAMATDTGTYDTYVCIRINI